MLAQLIFLFLPVALVKLAALGVKHVARQAMALFAGQVSLDTERWTKTVKDSNFKVTK